MSSLTRTLRLLPRAARPTAPLTTFRHASGYPNVSEDQSYPSHPSTTDPKDPRVGKNLRGDQTFGIGDPADFKNPNSGNESDALQGESHATDANASVVPKVSHAIPAFCVGVELT